MWNKPGQARLSKLPELYETEKTPVEDKIIYLHFFMGGCDWYAAEFDGEDRFFGYAVLNGDLLNAEWGYFSLSELAEVKIGFMQVDCEFEYAFEPRKASEVDQIRKGMGWGAPEKSAGDLAAEREFDEYEPGKPVEVKNPMTESQLRFSKYN
ncbi:MAG: DUF2958 domain-containing protein [Desulfobacteraceae bacterium]|nr:DUF2958 domain-containing protein [Desulfobacteraceae bacterium]